MSLDTLAKNVLYKTALLLSPKELKNLCLTNKNLHELICDNDDFWRQKLYQDYPETIGVFSSLNSSGEFKEIYKRTYNALIRLSHLEEISKRTGIDWKKATYFQIAITFNVFMYTHIASEESVIIRLYPIFISSDKFNEEDTENFENELLDHIPKELDEIGMNIYEKYRTENGFPVIIPSAEILKYIEPILLKKLKDLNIPIIQYVGNWPNRKMEKINFSNHIEVDFEEVSL